MVSHLTCCEQPVLRPARVKQKPPDQADPGARFQAGLGPGLQFGGRVAKVAALPTAVAELEMKGL